MSRASCTNNSQDRSTFHLQGRETTAAFRLLHHHRKNAKTLLLSGYFDLLSRGLLPEEAAEDNPTFPRGVLTVGHWAQKLPKKASVYKNAIFLLLFLQILVQIFVY